MKHLLVFIIFMMFSYCSAVPGGMTDRPDTRNYCFENVNEVRKAASLPEFNFDTEIFKQYSANKTCMSDKEMSDAKSKGYTVEKQHESEGVPKSMLKDGVSKFTCYSTRKCKNSGNDVKFYFLENGVLGIQISGIFSVVFGVLVIRKFF